MPRFPPGFIDDLKAQADIVAVIQDVVPLKQAGRSFKGLCPFHREKTPSFHVDREKGVFHCFGCDVGGDVLKFVELHERLSFPEAVTALAQRFGLRIPESDDPEADRAALAEREALLKAHEVAAAWFRAQLAAPAGALARRRLEERGIRPDTAARLGLGCAPPGRNALARHLTDAGLSPGLQLRSGLVVSRDGGPPADRFYRRLMIPIARDSGAVIAFGGRALDDDQQPKYLNSPETPLYAKGRTLYGLHLAKRAIRQCGYAVLVEGYFDLAQAIQGQVEPVIAVCGTALSDPQARLLRRYCSKALISFDPDAAGANAAARSGGTLLAAGFQINVVDLPPGEDPDACIRRRGAADYMARLRASRPYLEHLLDRAAARRDLSRDTERRALLAELLAVAARMPDRAARDQFADRIAHRTGVTDDVVRAEIRRAAVERRTAVRPEVAAVETAIRPAERGLIWAMMHETAAAQAVLAGVEPADLDGLRTASILAAARTLAAVPPAGAPAALLERLDPDEAALVRAIAGDAAAPAGPEDCGVELQRRRYERERAALQAEIDRRQRDGSPGALAEIDALWARKKALLQRLDALTG